MRDEIHAFENQIELSDECKYWASSTLKSSQPMK
jgi:hypothetical protein